MTRAAGGSGERATGLDAGSAFKARLARYRELAHDREAAVRWIVDVAGDLASPVLDIGTGKGLLAVELARRGLSVTTIDPNEADQGLALERGIRAGCAAAIRFVTGSAASLDAPPGSYGAAAMMDVLHHLDDPDPLFTRVSSVVRPGGRFLLAEFTPEGFALVARVHQEEGGEHAVGSVTFDDGLSALSQRGWRLATSALGHLHQVAVLERL